ncbi:hypothetical protein IVA93_28765 [Bradyrhizobium sp. 155]|uniref:hypothetical protein n=1 Tax=Bradyrhizobium sp. 155 TaxID=2782629 RepID=UPI001FFE523C|nr:hypothetical protein [Bradyrhizobium sp. 155]UPK10272.1 hypothetical protein IVA93_28765 [Bradyrhizobium sp. 155]
MSRPARGADSINGGALPGAWGDEAEGNDRQVKAALKPRDRIEEMYAEDLAQSDRQTTIFRRAASHVIAARQGQALYNFLAEHHPANDADRVALVERWSRGDLKARAEVAAALKEAGLNEFCLEAEAVLDSLSTLLVLEQLQSSKVARRDRALAGLAFYRRMQTQGQRPAQPDRDAVASDVLRLREPPSNDH